MTRLGVYTHNLRFYYRILEELRKWELPVVSLKTGMDSPKDVPVVFSSLNDPLLFSNQLRGDDPGHMIRHALTMILKKRKFEQVVIGVDPGPKPGVAVLADDILVEAMEFSDMINLTKFVKLVMQSYEYDSILVKLGHGDRPNRDRIIKYLSGLSIRIIIVNEDGTSMPHQTHDNVISAARIANIENFQRTGRTKLYGKNRRTQLDDEFNTIKNYV